MNTIKNKQYQFIFDLIISKAQKEKKLEEEILKELEDAQRVKAALDEEEKIFNSYAEKCIAEWANNVT